jgi:hypothetical protein
MTDPGLDYTLMSGIMFKDSEIYDHSNTLQNTFTKNME